MEKICKKHGLTEHTFTSNRYRCKKCNVENVLNYRQKQKNKAVEYKGGKCEMCGYNKFIGALEFHHVDGSKEFGISACGYTRSWKKIKNELDKCKLVCANCHREIHGNIQN